MWKHLTLLGELNLRALLKNTTRLWYVEPIDESARVELKDASGNYTGDFEFTFSTPRLIAISIYPTVGNVIREMYGIVGNFSYISSTPMNLSKQGMLYENQPTVNNINEYDYLIVEKKKSINGYSYGIEVRK